MAADLATFRARFPEFSTTADAVIEFKLEEAKLIHSVRQLATLFCAAHLVTIDAVTASPISGGGGSSGNYVREVSSEQVGPLRREYVTQSGSSSGSTALASDRQDPFFTGTKYGRQFLILEQRGSRSGMGVRVVG